MRWLILSLRGVADLRALASFRAQVNICVSVYLPLSASPSAGLTVVRTFTHTRREHLHTPPIC